MALYSPYKAVGYVTDGTAYCINRLGDDTFLTTSIGKAFQVCHAAQKNKTADACSRFQTPLLFHVVLCSIGVSL